MWWQRDESLLGQAAGRAHHQLLGHTHIVEPIGERIPENVNIRIFGQIRAEADDPVIFLGQFNQRIAEAPPWWDDLSRRWSR